MAVLYFVGNGHAYYLASLYPLLLGLGALPTAEWTLGARRRTPLLAAAIATSAAVSGLIALPLLPARNLQGSIVIALNSAQGDTVGWPSFVHTLSSAWREIPSSERRQTAIFTQNYGEARDRSPRPETQAPAIVQRPRRIQRVADPPGHRHSRAAGRFQQRGRRRALLRPMPHARHRR